MQVRCFLGVISVADGGVHGVAAVQEELDDPRRDVARRARHAHHRPRPRPRPGLVPGRGPRLARGDAGPGRGIGGIAGHRGAGLGLGRGRGRLLAGVAGARTSKAGGIGMVIGAATMVAAAVRARRGAVVGTPVKWTTRGSSKDMIEWLVVSCSYCFIT